MHMKCRWFACDLTCGFTGESTCEFTCELTFVYLLVNLLVKIFVRKSMYLYRNWAFKTFHCNPFWRFVAVSF